MCTQHKLKALRTFFSEIHAQFRPEKGFTQHSHTTPASTEGTNPAVINHLTLSHRIYILNQFGHSSNLIEEALT